MAHDLGPTSAYYEQLLATAEDDRTAVGWQTSYVQDVSFLSLARVGGLRDGARVLDVGCGLGALCTFLARFGVAVDYTGIDISEGMIAGARARHPGKRFEVRDILREPLRERFDVVVCCGALSFRTANHDALVRDMVAAMYRIADEAVAFNLLSAYQLVAVPALLLDDDRAYYAWPEDVLRWCKRLTRHVTLDHDADSGMFVVHMYRRNREALARYLAFARPGRSYGDDVQAAIDYHVELRLFRELLAFLAGIEPCAEVWLHRGQAHAALGEHADARAALGHAIAADRELAAAHHELGLVLADAGELDAAIAALRRAVEAAPEALDSHEALIKLCLAHDRLDAAQAALAAMPAGPVRDVLAAALAPDPAAARAALDRALAAAPRYLPALIQAAVVSEQLGDTAGALEMWQRALQIAPGDGSIAARIANLRKDATP